MKKTLTIILVVAFVATFINDVGRYAKARYDASTIAMEAATSLVGDRDQPRDTNARAAANFAQQKGATVYLFDQDDAGVHVWVQMPVEGTWVLARASALMGGNPMDAPFYVQAEDTAFFR